MPPNNGAYLMNLVLHLKQPDKESWVCKDKNEIWLLGGKQDTHHVSIAKAINWFNDDIRIYLRYAVVCVLDCST